MTALDWGWKAVLRDLSISRKQSRFLKSRDSNLSPWSLCILCGQPKRLVQCSINAVAVVDALWTVSGTASYHLVKWSPIKRIICVRWIPVRVPRSQCQCGGRDSELSNLQEHRDVFLVGYSVSDIADNDWLKVSHLLGNRANKIFTWFFR